MEPRIAALCLLLLLAGDVLLVVLLVRSRRPDDAGRQQELESWLEERLARQADDFGRLLQMSQDALSKQNYAAIRGVKDAVDGMGVQLTGGQSAQQKNLEGRFQTMEKTLESRLRTLELSNTQRLEEMRRTLTEGMDAVRAENAKKLDEIRHTVDEQLQDTLQKRVSESFKTVSDQLEQVYKGLGEMQSLAADVGGLKQVLSGVKTRGILGEIQLGAILEEILAPEQYGTNVATIPGSTQRVEFAVKLPGADGQTVWLPIDSKFPGDTYAHLQDALASGDAQAVEAARRALEQVIRAEAKDIRTKYVEPPYTTNFGILFLPFEGLYAEVVNRGMVETLQRDYQVNVAGPSTMAALLNSLQMGFKTLAIQKRSNEVWQVLGAVKTEFEKFNDGLVKLQDKLRQSDQELDKLIGTRTRAINRKLRAVQSLDESSAAALLELDAAPGQPPRASLPDAGGPAPAEGEIFAPDGEDIGGPADEKSPAHYQYKGRYIMTAVKSGLMIIDQRRAHVRILYDRYMSQIQNHGNASQRMLFPDMVHFSPAEIITLQNITDDLGYLGFELGDLGNGTYAINGIPAGIEGLNPERLLTDLVHVAMEKEGKVKEEVQGTLALALAREMVHRLWGFPLAPPV